MRETHDACRREIEVLDSENVNLSRENKMLRLDLEACRKQLVDLDANNRME